MAPLILAGGVLLGTSAGNAGAGMARPGMLEDGEQGRAERVRELLEERITQRFPAQGGMVAALLLAERDGVDRELRDAFRRTGTSHLLAISGFHVGVIAGWIVLALRLARLNRRRAIVGAAVITWLYAALLGFPGSAVRAATIFGLLAVGRAVDRPVRGLGAWGSALLLIALFRPGEVTRIGTQLSFLGSLGLILWATRWGDGLNAAVARWCERFGLRSTPPGLKTVCQAVAASAAAQWATLPLAAWSFQQVAPAGLPVTLLATPLVSFALPGALITLVADALHLPGTRLLAEGVEALLWALGALITHAAQIGPVLYLTPFSVALSVTAGVVARYLSRGRPGLRAAGLVPVTVVSMTLIAAPIADLHRSRNTRLHFLDVGQGDAIAIQTREGRWILIDTGPPPGTRLVQDLVALGVSRIDLMVLSHPDLDHIGGAADVLRAIPVTAVLDPLSVRGGPYRELTSLARERGVHWRGGVAGDVFSIDEVAMEVLSPTAELAVASVNDRSLVLRADINGYLALFTGDISLETEEILRGRFGDVNLLKVAHHGSRTSTGESFLSEASPEIAVIQVGRWNRFGHPDGGVLSRLQGRGTRVLRTDRAGQITLSISDGEVRRVETRLPGN